ncbi:CD40 ligand isoform X2 [Phyllopteryx taeniolatus]|uniref:CD40 ligand isoform X2 n=1 Tax=Phyllopteryx taeniolatus TaxID=161469 RepID=UPI002AD22F2F|nr:CD40 ligand isoform X2 [Phyllopteryx taeniolatus]
MTLQSCFTYHSAERMGCHLVLISVIMINTYHSSVASPPPPLPPRQSQVFIQPQGPSASHSKNLFRSLLAVVVLHFLLTVGGFAFLYYTGRMEKPLSEASSSSRALARMIVVKRIRNQESTCKQLTPSCHLFSYLQWDMKHSVRSNVNYYHSSWLTVLQPGDYLVFSRVSFSKADPKRPLASAVKLKRGASSKETVAMQAYCSLNGSVSIPRLCTASLVEVMTLETGNQLSLWVQDLSLVDYSETATSFGMYKL